MNVVLRWFRLIFSFCVFTLFVFLAFNSSTCIYLVHQGIGQAKILSSTTTFEQYLKTTSASRAEIANLKLIQDIKKFSEDSLGFIPTKNFTSIYDQKNKPVLWVITVSEPYSLKAYTWNFPIIGKVSYKGYFKKEFAEKAAIHFRSAGYDVELRSVSAWSTLGWFNDPVLSNMLQKEKGALCDLIFHELFHSTCYLKSSVNVNENLASFIGYHATLRFLQNDTAAISIYRKDLKRDKSFRQFLQTQGAFLDSAYAADEPVNSVLKAKLFYVIGQRIMKDTVEDPARLTLRKDRILLEKNAYFIGYDQYHSLQDSLESVFNNIYRGDLKKMVRDLKLLNTNS